MLPDRFRRKGQKAERPPAEGVREEDDKADWNEQQRAKPRLSKAAKPEPQAEREQRQGHRQREIDEAEHEGMAERQRQCEGDGRRQAVVHFTRHPQHAGHGHRRDRQHHQLGCQLDPY